MHIGGPERIGENGGESELGIRWLIVSAIQL